MKLSLIPLMLPADISKVMLRDIDNDGVPELICVQERKHKSGINGHTIRSYELSGRSVLEHDSIALGRKALIWDASSGFWALDSKGLRDANGVHQLPIKTWFRGLGPTTPLAGQLRKDLDGDGTKEWLLPAAGELVVAKSTADGPTQWGVIPLTATGELRQSDRAGGKRLQVSRSVVSTAIGDVDGDGRKDVLLLEPTRATAMLTGELPGASTRILTFPQPIMSTERAQKSGRSLDSALLKDIDGDGKLDVFWEHTVRSGSWFGSTAQLEWSLGNGQSFSKPQALSINKAVISTSLSDIDGDGDRDLLIIGTDFGLASIGKALISRSVDMQVTLHRYNNGFSAAEKLIEIDVPIDATDSIDVRLEDVNGDGVEELISVLPKQLSIRLQDGSTKLMGLGVGGRIASMASHPDGHMLLLWNDSSRRGELVVIAP